MHRFRPLAPICNSARVRVHAHVVVAAAACVLVSSCSEPSPPPLQLAAGCNPLLAGRDCMLPWPSDFFVVNDATMPSGHRVQMEGAAKLTTQKGLSADTNDFIPIDGFSRQPTIVAVLGAPMRDEGFAHIFDGPDASTSATSHTLLLDAETGAAVPHLADFDARATDPERTALLLRPSVQLGERHRYVVVLQGIAGVDGATLPAAEGYRRLRDGEARGDAALEPLVAHYDAAIFPVLDKAHVARGSTQLVWDFTTGTDASVMDDMLRARALVLDELARTPPVVRLSAVRPDPQEGAWRIVLGEIDGPSVMDGDGGPGTRLARDDDGRVRLNGTTTFPFTAVIPPSVRDSFTPAPAVLYGHGFFGGQGEVGNPTTPKVLDGAHAVGFAIDWVGMASDDVGYVVRGVGEVVSESLLFGERVPQAMANWLTLTKALQGPMQDVVDGSGTVAFRRPLVAGAPGVVFDPGNAAANNAGALVFDPAHVDYLGISQGHILGGVMTTLNPDVKHIALQVGGCAFSHMMSRASPFKTYLALLDYSMGDPLEEQKLIATYQRGFDRFDPATYAPYLLREDLPSGPPSRRADKRVLMQIGIGDDQVPNFASFTHARILGLPLLTPTPREVPLLEQQPLPHTGSGLMLFDLGVDDSFYEQAMPAQQGTPTHEGVRRRAETQAQLRRFFDDGTIINPCGERGCALANP